MKIKKKHVNNEGLVKDCIKATVKTKNYAFNFLPFSFSFLNCFGILFVYSQTKKSMKLTITLTFIFLVYFILRIEIMIFRRNEYEKTLR